MIFTIRNNKEFTITYLPTFRDSIGDKIDLFTDYRKMERSFVSK